MRLFLVLFLSMLNVSVANASELTCAETEVSGGFYNDEQKWRRASACIGASIPQSRAEMVSGYGQGVAKTITARLYAATGYRWWVCRETRAYGLVVVGCARHHKLQRYVAYNNVRVFNPELQDFLEYSSAPLYIDWGWR